MGARRSLQGLFKSRDVSQNSKCMPGVDMADQTCVRALCGTRPPVRGQPMPDKQEKLNPAQHPQYPTLLASCSPTDAEGTRRTLDFCAGLTKPPAGAQEELTGESVTSPATVAALAQNFGGSSARKRATQVRLQVGGAQGCSWAEPY